MNDHVILIRNIFYMLAYVYVPLRQKNYQKAGGEDFDGIFDLFAEILSIGVAAQLKQGLRRDYKPCTECLTTLRGRLDLSATIDQRLRRQTLLGCQFDELSFDNDFNRIIRTAVEALLRWPQLSLKNRRGLRRLLPFFEGIGTVNTDFPWRRLQFGRDSGNYRMLIDVCRFVIDDLLPLAGGDGYEAVRFAEDGLCHLYERFIRAYYCRHFHGIKTSAAVLDWQVDGIRPTTLPVMKTDVTLEFGGRILIIDAKYYGHTMQEFCGSHTIRSDNLYQIYAYVKNRDRFHNGSVGGMLLYAKTQESSTPDEEFSLDGNRFFVRTLDLNRPFAGIAAQLDGIIGSFFGVAPGLQRTN